MIFRVLLVSLITKKKEFVVASHAFMYSAEKDLKENVRTRGRKATCLEQKSSEMNGTV
jgi:hypothetical protein